MEQIHKEFKQSNLQGHKLNNFSETVSDLKKEVKMFHKMIYLVCIYKVFNITPVTVVPMCSVKRVFLKILQNAKEINCLFTFNKDSSFL